MSADDRDAAVGMGSVLLWPRRLAGLETSAVAVRLRRPAPQPCGGASAVVANGLRDRLVGDLAPSGALRQPPVELATRRDVELREHLAQVVGDGVRTDEQTGADLRIR